MSNANLTKHISIQEGSLVLKYVDFLGLSHAKLNTCKLFWAIVFAPLILGFYFLLAFPVIFVGRQIGKLLPDPKPQPSYLERLEEQKRQREEKEARGPSRAERFFTAVANFMSAQYFRWQAVIRFLAYAIATLILFAAVTVIVVLVVTYIDEVNWSDVLTAVLILLAAVAIVIAVFTAFSFILSALDKRGKIDSISRRLKGFFRLLGDLGSSFHNHTCAVVDIEKKSSDEQYSIGDRTNVIP